jgi:hypothetical protein
MSYLRYLCLFAHSGVQQILCCVFVFFSSLDCHVYYLLIQSKIETGNKVPKIFYDIMFLEEP